MANWSAKQQISLANNQTILYRLYNAMISLARGIVDDEREN
jgi:hypothetical protein